ncbi:uncharacterized protein PGTG_11837 [Puccinia graminis f. sp. tritici CRL 75-36-700-3]|uniref:Uncharacterized protein n=1 Tax=Puccinia graminis f. sp. tritici (strain CRL 75-36-700-3 / race SCCL) TaxID=418459 RepID=E3KMF6_PUCGT|nr:uncharacterized protein PGTG_11837 [Puccinia graminis f. sp. tritici CRL 75-36-700-3]EFP85481.2 hypothetical protein PGTG_11837 [Puccinia graminis f. sp. tritici CRL 75-36-700-3]
MSIEREVKLLRQELYQLQIKLKDVESKLLGRTTLESTRNRNDYPSIIRNDLASSRSNIAGKVMPAVRKGNQSTLRSRSFKVMRHLINIVDVSQAASTDSNTEKKRTARDSSRDPITSAAPVTKSKASVKPKKATNSPPKGPSALLSSQKNSCVSSLSLQPLIKSQPPVAPKSIKKCLTPPNDLKNTPSTSSATPCRFQPKHPCQVKPLNDLPSTHKESDYKKSQTTSEVIEYKKLRRGCGRFSLLKYDPAVLDLLPASIKDRRFLETKTVTDIEDLPQASADLIRRQVLGIWEWKEGTSSATLHKYKTPELGTTISNKGFKFVGFGWRGDLGQPPPRIEELHEDISQGTDTLRWYWFKDLWLLFYFD